MEAILAASGPLSWSRIVHHFDDFDLARLWPVTARDSLDRLGFIGTAIVDQLICRQDILRPRCIAERLGGNSLLRTADRSGQLALMPVTVTSHQASSRLRQP
jgi:hypothetical protein